MDNNDRQAIDGLFGRLSDVERQAGPRDPQAESLISERVAAQPSAPYFMAQTIVVQEQALNAAQDRIQQLEDELSSRPASGGLLSSLFGSPASARRPAAPARPVGSPQGAAASPGGAAGPWGQQRGGGGFLAGAAQTAMGVAGGVLLGNAIAGMLGGNEAQAAEPAAPEDVAAGDEGGFGDAGGFDGVDF